MTILVIGLLIPLLGTMLGSAFAFMMKGEMSARLQKALLGFASGVMVAASVWSLLIPAMEMDASGSAWAVMPAAVGFLLGIGFLLLIDELTPHLHLGSSKPEGLRSHLSRTAMLALAVTIHNLPDCLQEVRRVLKPGGRFVIMVEVIEGDSMWTNVVEGMTAYSPEQLQKLLDEAGFTDTAIHRKKPSYAAITGVKQASKEQS